ncbi:MAG: anthranilate synthase component I [bacterium]
MYYPGLNQFKEKANLGNLIPVYRTICADMETPVSAFKKIDRYPSSFLLESVVGGERIARYSFLGTNPSKIICPESTDNENPLTKLRNEMSKYTLVPVEGLPRFFGGAVGYFSYDQIRHLESIPSIAPDVLKIPDYMFFITDTLLIFDHLTNQITIVSNAIIDGPCEQIYKKAMENIEKIVDLLASPLSGVKCLEPGNLKELPAFESNFNKDNFKRAVVKIKEYIAAGDIIQAVLSQRLSTRVECDPFDLYRAIRLINPSPYMYYLKHHDLKIIGSSPELLVRLEDGMVYERPIAGTRKRGESEAEDEALAQELLADPKERAEHIMLVDLSRNDVGRVCEYGTVHIPDGELMTIERYSHVMHIVSQVKGKLCDGKDAFDVFAACFPAGTVSGAPKIRAMEIIEEIEPSRRGPYAGSVGYFSFSGNMDTGITIRTLVLQGDTAYIQAGAGIVADSDPEKEYEETLNKARAVIEAVRLAEGSR